MFTDNMWWITILFSNLIFLFILSAPVIKRSPYFYAYKNHIRRHPKSTLIISVCLLILGIPLIVIAADNSLSIYLPLLFGNFILLVLIVWFMIEHFRDNYAVSQEGLMYKGNGNILFWWDIKSIRYNILLKSFFIVDTRSEIFCVSLLLNDIMQFASFITHYLSLVDIDQDTRIVLNSINRGYIPPLYEKGFLWNSRYLDTLRSANEHSECIEWHDKTVADRSKDDSEIIDIYNKDKSDLRLFTKFSEGTLSVFLVFSIMISIQIFFQDLFPKVVESDRLNKKSYTVNGNKYQTVARGITNSPDFVSEVNFNLGLWYAHVGKYPKAIDSFVKATKIKPMWADAHYYLGMAYKYAGDMTAALEEYSILKELDGNLAEKLYVVINKQ